MKTTSNNIYREYIINMMLSDNEYPDVELDDGMRCYLCARKIKNIDIIENDLFKGFYEALISVIFLDAIKTLNLKEKELSISYLEQETLDTIKSIVCLEDLKDAIKGDEFLLEELLGYFLEFYRMNDFRKITAFKALNPGYQELLKSEYILYENDNIEYSKKLTLDMIAKCAKKQMEIEKGQDDNEDIAYDIVLTRLISFFSNLNRDDIFKFRKLVKEMIKLDYKWIKYIKDKNYICEWIIPEELEYRIELYEDNKSEHLVTEALYDDCYFEQIIDSFLSIKYDNMNIDKKILNQGMVDEYYKKLNKKRK